MSRKFYHLLCILIRTFQYIYINSTNIGGYMKNSIIKGTLILTAAGVTSRLIGFFYRVFLSNTIGANGMGLLQLVTPIMSLSFAICVSGIQTAISKFVAANKKQSENILLTGLSLSLSMSLVLAFLFYFNAEFIANRFFLNSQCAILIKGLALSIPFSSIHSSICGYYYGHERAGVPAFSQLFEQLIRVCFVYGIIIYYNSINKPVTVIIAIYGIVLGEIATVIYCFISLFWGKRMHFKLNSLKRECRHILLFSYPITFNKILTTLLQSGEAILIPAQLIIYGLNETEALSVYGVLMGMALPLILFPSAITSSASSMLLPSVSQAQSNGKTTSVSHTINSAIHFCLVLGIYCTGMFVVYGGDIGSILFGNTSVKTFILILAWLSPFMYVATTMSGILNGLGKTTSTSIQNTIGIIIRLVFIVLLIPIYGINGYLWGLLVSQIYVCFMHILTAKKYFGIALEPIKSIIVPIMALIISIGISLLAKCYITSLNIIPELLTIIICSIIATVIFCVIIFYAEIKAMLKKK